MNKQRRLISNSKDKIAIKFAPVSVILPCYNSEQTIARAIKSVVTQTLIPIEIIVIDDCSTDSTLEVIAREFGAVSIPRITTIRLPNNRGPAYARNAGWNRSTQKYVAFLDSDDEWHPQKIEIQYSLHEKNPDIKLSGHRFSYAGDTNTNAVNAFSKFIEITKFKMLFRNRFVTPSVMCVRNLKDRFPTNQRYMEDYYLWLKIILHNHKVAMLPNQLVILHKPLFGAAGLSRNFVKMEYHEVKNYFMLYHESHISLLASLY